MSPENPIKSYPRSLKLPQKYQSEIDALYKNSTSYKIPHLSKEDTKIRFSLAISKNSQNKPIYKAKMSYFLPTQTLKNSHPSFLYKKIILYSF